MPRASVKQIPGEITDRFKSMHFKTIEVSARVFEDYFQHARVGNFGQAYEPAVEQFHVQAGIQGFVNVEEGRFAVWADFDQPIRGTIS